MSLPPRCFTCNTVIGHQWEQYVTKLQEGKKDDEVLRELDVHNFCCKRMFVTNVAKIDSALIRGAFDPTRRTRN